MLLKISKQRRIDWVGNIQLEKDRVIKQENFDERITVNRGEIVQSLNFKYLYKSHCKSNELLWAFKGYHII